MNVRRRTLAAVLGAGVLLIGTACSNPAAQSATSSSSAAPAASVPVAPVSTSALGASSPAASSAGGAAASGAATGSTAAQSGGASSAGGSAGANMIPASCKSAKPVLGVSLPNTVNPYYIAMRDSFEKNGAAAGFDVKVAIAADSDSTQLSQVQSFVDAKVCAIALNGVNSGPAAASAALAYRAGIPVFTVNVIVSPDDLKAQGAKIVQYVGADQAQGGQVMGEAVLADLGKDAKIVVGIGGDPDQIPTNQRDEGFAKALASNPNAKVVQTVNTKVDPNISLQVITEMLQGKPDINVVFADTGPATVGAIQAIKQLNLSGKVALYGFCAADQALDATLYRGCSAQEPADYAGIVVKNVKTYLGGSTVQAEQLVPVKVFAEGQTPKPGEVG